MCIVPQNTNFIFRSFSCFVNLHHIKLFTWQTFMHCVLIEINITALVLLHHHIFLYIVQKNQQLQMDMRDVLHHAHCVVDRSERLVW